MPGHFQYVLLSAWSDLSQVLSMPCLLLKVFRLFLSFLFLITSVPDFCLCSGSGDLTFYCYMH
jgi:hypothetical protein